MCAGFYNDDIKYICNTLAISIPDIADTIYEQEIVVNNRKLTCHISIEDSVVCHIGISMFPAVLHKGNDKWLYRFVERKILLYSLLKDNTVITRDLNFNDAIIYIGSKGGVHRMKDYREMLLYANAREAYLKGDSATCIAYLYNGTDTLGFIFKRNYFNLTGTNKIEADNKLFKHLSIVHNVSYAGAENDYCMFPVLLNDSVMAMMGKTYLNCFRSTYYVVRKRGRCLSVYDSCYPVLSFVNSIIRAEDVCVNIKLLLTHSQYKGLSSMVVKLPVLINYLRQEHELYLGLEDTTSTLSGTLIAYNKSLNYLHLLSFKVVREKLFAAIPEYECRLYSFIPACTIDNLFGEYKKSKNTYLYGEK